MLSASVLKLSDGNEIKIVWADTELFMVPSDSNKANYCEEDYDPIRLKRKKKEKNTRP